MSRIDINFLIEHKHKENTTEHLHTHPCAELVYYARGKGKSVIGSHEYDYSDNTVAFISSNAKHSEYHEAETEVMFFGCNFDNEIFNLSNGVFEDKDKKLYGFFQDIFQEYYSKELYYKIAMENLAEKILLLLARKANKAYKKSIDDYIGVAVNYINANLQNDITPASVAEKLGYSYGYFRHQFLKCMGVSPKKYILTARIDAAKEYLANSDQPIEEIAERFLFANSSHFSTAFKQYIGVLPSQYRAGYIIENSIDVEYQDRQKEEGTDKK